MNDPGIRIDLMGPAGDELSLSADAVMPVQFYPARRGAASVEPIKRLMAGILIDAVRSFQRNLEARSSDRRQEFREAQFWVFDDKGNFFFPECMRLVGDRSRRLEELDCSLAERQAFRR